LAKIQQCFRKRIESNVLQEQVAAGVIFFLKPTFELSNFLAENGAVDPGDLAQVSFIFDRSPRGISFWMISVFASPETLYLHLVICEETWEEIDDTVM